MANKFNLDGFAVDTDNQCTAEGGFIGDLTGNVTGDLTGKTLGNRADYYPTDSEINTDDKLVQCLTSSGAIALTLPDGEEGQVIYLKRAGASNNAVITPDNFFDGTTITLASTLASATLIFNDTSWCMLSAYGTVTIA